MYDFERIWNSGGQILFGAFIGIIGWHFLLRWARREGEKLHTQLPCALCQKPTWVEVLHPCSQCKRHICHFCDWEVRPPLVPMEPGSRFGTSHHVTWCVNCVPEDVKNKAAVT